MGTVYTGSGTVWENLTCRLPVLNPSQGYQGLPVDSQVLDWVWTGTDLEVTVVISVYYFGLLGDSHGTQGLDQESLVGTIWDFSGSPQGVPVDSLIIFNLRLNIFIYLFLKNCTQ